MTSSSRRFVSLALSLTLFAAACGSGGNSTPEAQSAPTTTTVAVVEGAAMADEDGAMEDDDAMADDDGAMEDDAMADDAMDDDAMADEDDAMEDGDAMADNDAMEDGDAMAEGRPILDVSFDGLEPLGDDFDYEVWTIVDGEPVTGGLFDIGADGAVAIDGQDHLYGHDGATAVVISIEPEVGDVPEPAATKVLGGEINDDGSFDLTTAHPAALGVDLTDVSGSFILGTPTNDPDGDELSGVWFLSLPGPEASLDLPTLPEGWTYEGWAVIDGVPVSTGRFLSATGADDFDGFSGPDAGPNYPGEDFIVNAPDGVTFPTDLTQATIVISVEPDADNSPAPFALKPLVAEVPDGLGDHENTPFGQGPAPVSGSGSMSS